MKSFKSLSKLGLPSVVASNLAFLVALNGCSPKSQTLATETVIPEQKVEIPKFEPINPPELKWITEDGGQRQLDFNPRIDILFLIDNSDSMKTAQKNLQDNISRFVSGISQNRMIDYHIGVISTWDSSERAMKTKPDPYEIGELRHIKDKTGKSYKNRFLDRKTATPDVLFSTIHIGVLPLEQGGPENEEFFAPLTAALEKSGPGGVNDGFFREDAQLVVVIMTDADEKVDRITPEQMVRTLQDFKQGQKKKVTVYGALVKAEDKEEFKDWMLRIHPKYNEQCFTKDSKGRMQNNGTCSPFGPKNLEAFIRAANLIEGQKAKESEQFLLGITDPKFGKHLGRIGDDITVKILEKTIYLSQRPRIDKQNKMMIRVRYGSPDDLAKGGGQVIPQGLGGWLYNNDENSIYLPGNIQYKYVEGARFAVDLVPLTLQ